MFASEGKTHHRVGVATWCLHISAVLYFLVALFVVIGSICTNGERGPVINGNVGVVLVLVCLAIIVGIEKVVAGLHRRQFWAWVVALCIFGMYVPSLFLPLGALGLWGLLDPESRTELGIRVNPKPGT